MLPMRKRVASTDITAHPSGHKGRGAVSNASGRFEGVSRVLTDDGWGAMDEEPPHLATTVIIDATRTVITRNASPDLNFDRSINPYRGCEHGCTYCFARPTHAYLGLSPGLDFEAKLFAKPSAPILLAHELAKASYVPRMIALGTNTDPYQPIERNMEITRGILTVLRDFRHPVGIVTKSHLVTRDSDILGDMAGRNLAKAAISITTLDRKLARSMEPRAATPERRLAAIKALAEAGIPVTVMAAPMIPGLNDHELEGILEAARAAGATGAGYIVLRMPMEIKDLFREWLAAAVPDRAQRVISLMRDMRGGQDYDAEWGRRMRGTGPYAQLIAKRFRVACQRLRLNEVSRELDCSQFRVPPRKGDQLALL
ncbi:MAG TPA: radical SAM protein [Alphaproteobacteria bacterium]|nr:radical SAM protein [Alphaproteobacteria bacterium]